jgi:rhodanese-related sulfurtransferase
LYLGGNNLSGIKSLNKESLKPQEVFKLIKNQENDNFVILDVRAPWEYSKEHIDGAKNLDFTDPDFEKKLSEIDKEKTYFIYCKFGIRGEKVMNLMRNSGFAHVYNILGGLEEWKKQNLPIQTL